MVDGGESGMRVVFPGGDRMCVGWSRFERVRDGPVVSADVDSDEVIGEV